MAEKEVSFLVRVTDAASGVLGQIEAAANKTTEKLFSLKDIFKELVLAAGAFSLGEIVKDMVELGTAADKTFRQIAASLPTFTEGIGELKEGIEQLANASGRSLEEMEQSAAAIAKLGVSSAQELKQQLEAATLLADATGTSVDEASQLLIQLRREFNLTGNEALATAAKLASAAQGKVAITELFSAFQQSAPIFQKFNIDLDTGTKAIIALVERGDGIRQIRKALGELDASGIKELAGQATIASDALEQLTKRSNEVRESISATATRTKNELVSALEDFGLAVMVKAKPAFDFLTNWFKLLKEALGDRDSLLQLFGAIASIVNGDARGLSTISALMSGSGRAVLSSTFTNVGTANPVPPMPETAAAKKAVDDAAIAQAKFTLELMRTNDAEAVATDKALELARAQGTDLRIAIESALGAASGHLAVAAAQAIDDRATKLTREIVLNEALDEATKLRLLHEVELTRQIEQAQNAAAPVLNQGALTLSAIGIPGSTTQGDLTALMAQEQALLATDRSIVAVGGDDQKVKAQLLEIEKKRADILKGMVADGAASAATTAKSAEEEKQQILQMAQAWSAVGRSIIAGAQAVGQMDAATAAALQNVVSLGDGIVRLFAGDIVGGIAETASSLAALAKSLFTSTTAEDQAHAKVLEDNSAALRHLAETIKGVVVMPGSYAAAGQAIDMLQARGSQAGSMYPFGGLGVKADLSSLSPLQIDKLNAAAKALGITLDGSEAAFLQLKAAIDAAEPELEKTYLAIQKEAQEDYKVRELRAEGLNREADALEFTERQERERTKAVEANADADTLAALDAAQAAEATEFFAQQAGNAGDAVTAAGDAIAAAVTKVNDALSALSDYNDVHGITDPYGQIAGTAGTAGAAGGAIDLSGYDLTTQAGRDAALGALRTAWDDSAGNPAFRIVLKALIDEIYHLPPIADASAAGGATPTKISGGVLGNPLLKGITNSFAGLTSTQGDRLSDYAVRQLGVLIDIRDLLAGKFTVTVPGALGRGTGAAGSWNGAGSITIGTLAVNVGAGIGNAQQIGTDAADAFIREIDRKLGRKVNVERLFQGSITQTPS